MQSISKSQPVSSTATATAAIVDTATTYLQVFSTLDPNVISSIQSENFKHTFAPKSANPPPPRNRDEFASHIKHLNGIISSFPVQAKQIWPNPLHNQVTIWADSETVFHQHVKDSDDEDEWRYRGEYIFILDLDTEGKIENVLEFLDSKGTDRLRGLMARAWKKKEELEAKETGK
jgi:hypothetical protein